MPPLPQEDGQEADVVGGRGSPETLVTDAGDQWSGSWEEAATGHMHLRFISWAGLFYADEVSILEEVSIIPHDL